MADFVRLPSLAIHRLRLHRRDTMPLSGSASFGERAADRAFTSKAAIVLTIEPSTSTSSSFSICHSSNVFYLVEAKIAFQPLQQAAKCSSCYTVSSVDRCSLEISARESGTRHKKFYRQRQRRVCTK